MLKKKLKNNKNIQEAGLGALAYDPYYWALILRNKQG